MAQEVFKVKADEQGVWIWLVGREEEADMPALIRFLRDMGIRQYDDSSLRTFFKEKKRTPFKIAVRDSAQELDAPIIVDILQKGLFASVSLDVPFFTKPWPSTEEIKEALAAKGVIFGIDDSAIEKLSQLKIAGESIVVAEGMAPIDGEDGRIENLVAPSFHKTFDPDASSVDFKDSNSFVSVSKGQVIAVKHHPTRGEDGISVTGSGLAAIPGREVFFHVGSGLKVSKDGMELVAATDGQLCAEAGRLKICPKLEVQGDVDYEVGNIDFEGGVQVGGGVREGFRLVATGPVEITDSVEGAYVQTLGDILIHGGIYGMGKSCVMAGGKVVVGFTAQAYVRSQSQVEIKKGSYHSDIVADTSILVWGSESSRVVGGRLEAGVEISCQTLGSDVGTRTVAVVGFPNGLSQRSEELKKLINQHNTAVEKLDANVSFLRKQEAAVGLDDQKQALLTRLVKTKYNLKGTLVTLEEELRTIAERLACVHALACVKVKGVCYPGVEIDIRGAKYKVQDKCSFVSFIEDQGKVRLAPYSYKFN